MLTVEEIIEHMRANYTLVVGSLPPDLRQELQNKALPLKELEELAPFIRTTTEFEGTASTGLTQRKIGRKVSVIAFNKKLVAAGIRPEDIYGSLLKGCFRFE